MEAVVTATAMNTFFGKTAALVVKATRTQKSHFQKAVLKIGNGLILLTICLAILLIIVSLLGHDPILECYVSFLFLLWLQFLLHYLLCCRLLWLSVQ